MPGTAKGQPMSPGNLDAVSSVQRQMSWIVGAVATLLLVATACTAADTSTTTTSTAGTSTIHTRSICSSPPAGEMEPDSEFEISLDPNPVDAGREATLSIDFEGHAPSDYIGGAGASWECWNGDRWVETHVLVRAFNKSTQPSVIDLSADTDTGIPDIGLIVPSSYQVLIPQVAPGTYRITDRIFGPGPTLTGHILFEVGR